MKKGLKGLLRTAIEFLKRQGLDYADLRYERITGESIQVRDGVIEGFSTDLSAGVGIRVLYRGAWGFAASHVASEEDCIRTAREAIAIARAFSSVNRVKARLSEAAACKDSFSTPFRTDPFRVSPEEKIGLLMDVTGAALREKDIAVCEAFMEFSRAEKEFMNTEGAEISQTILTSGGGYYVIAEDGNEAQKRSYPDAHHGLFATMGYEIFDEIDMKGSVGKTAEEARSLLKARECPNKKTDVIIDGAQMALQLHESCGHPAELDRVLGSEISFAGGSFLTLDKMGSYRFGSRCVNIYADPAHPGGAGTYVYDDEGVRAGRVEIVREGVFQNYLTSRESAAVIGKPSNGAMRAESWSGLPLVRMNNICIEPGDASLEEIIADTREGILLSTNRSWSIDDLRLNFQFGTEIAYEIKNGQIGQPFKNPVYYGITPRFWASCDAVADKGSWRMWGLNSCGKGEPMQTANVGHGASPARFRGVDVGVLREGL